MQSASIHSHGAEHQDVACISIQVTNNIVVTYLAADFSPTPQQRLESCLPLLAGLSLNDVSRLSKKIEVQE